MRKGVILESCFEQCPEESLPSFKCVSEILNKTKKRETLLDLVFSHFTSKLTPCQTDFRQAELSFIIECALLVRRWCLLGIKRIGSLANKRQQVSDHCYSTSAHKIHHEAHHLRCSDRLRSC
ncbi:putative Cuticular protein [Daphnia magna]|uniref:Putative Cuticular protein n=1 Tax=Daphnia magna TaxID=35525 RepID=A0A164V7K8_9CRUS|nr:putative Cuticular protein [Daphnia magna]